MPLIRTLLRQKMLPPTVQKHSRLCRQVKGDSERRCGKSSWSHPFMVLIDRSKAFSLKTLAALSASLFLACSER